MGLMPFHTYLWKVASNCNINCSYCYIYSSPDSRWRLQPKLMSERVARQTARRMREHLEAHQKSDASIIFHGGEPLLGGLRHLEMLSRVISEELHGSGVRLSVGMQSNLLLFTPDIGAFMRERGMSIGVSIDGPPHINDIFRIDHQGRPTSALLENKLALLASADYRSVFSGFLCVINPNVDAVEVTEYLLSYNPPGIDFLYPLNNHDRPPEGKMGFDHAPYGDWLTRAYDCWIESGTSSRIRVFESILAMICGSTSLVESIGLNPVDIIVVETNGDVEAVDSLKSTFEGATVLGYNVFDHAFDEVASDINVRARQMGGESLCDACRSCPLLDICGGGYIPHRYSSARKFGNPSIYCADIQKVIRHMHRSLKSEFALAQGAPSHA